MKIYLLVEYHSYELDILGVFHDLDDAKRIRHTYNLDQDAEIETWDTEKSGFLSELKEGKIHFRGDIKMVNGVLTVDAYPTIHQRPTKGWKEFTVDDNTFVYEAYQRPDLNVNRNYIFTVPVEFFVWDKDPDSAIQKGFELAKYLRQNGWTGYAISQKSYEEIKNSGPVFLSSLEVRPISYKEFKSIQDKHTVYKKTKLF